MTEERRIQLVAEVDTTRTRTGFGEIVQQADTMAADVTRSGEQAQRAVTNIGAGADRAARDVEGAQRNLIASIQRTTAAMQAGTRSGAEYYEVLARQRGVDPAVLEPYLAQLRAIEGAQRNVGVSAAQTAAALRNVPAQVTDIVTSLQGGQAPLTVFLQQGGQLRDMFGGAGAAARALGSYLVGLISPLTVLAATIGIAAVAYHQAEAEAQAFNRALIVSGNAAGTTTGQLTEMARAIGVATNGTQGAASAALAGLAGTGRVAVENLRGFGTAAIQAQKAGVQSVEETTKAFDELGKTPLQTSVKLNEQLRYLTGSLYAQIKALQDTGREEEAAEVAQKAYASALEDRSAKMVQTLGTAEKAWAGLTGAAKKGWDAVLDIGREDTLEQKLAAVQAKIAKANDSTLSPLRRRDASVDLKGNEVLERLLIGQIKLQNEGAAAEAKANKEREASLEWTKQITANLTRQDQLENELAANRAHGKAAAESGDSRATPEAILEQEKIIKQKYADIYNDGINSQIEAIKRRADIEDIVAKRSLDLLTANRAAGLIGEEKYTEDVAKIELAAFARHKKQLQEELTLTAGKLNSQKDQASLRGEIEKQDELATSRRLQLTNDLNTIRSKGEQDVAKQIVASVLQRKSLNASLEVEYSLYGKTADARELALVSIKSEAELQKKIADAVAAKKPLTEEQIARLRDEKRALDEVTTSVMAQTKALGYAQQLHDTNERYAAESIADEKQRAAAILAIDARVWRERIELAGEGTEAQKKLQEEFDVWYANRQLAPVVDQWKKVIGNLDDNFQTGFRDMLTSGQSTWTSFAKSISNTLKTSLADALYQTFIKKYVVQVVTSLAGSISGSNVAAALNGANAASAGSSVVGAINGASALSSGLGLVQGGLIGAGNSISGFGSALGSTIISDFGAGLSGLAPAAAQAYGGTMTAAASAGASINAALAAIPGWGWAAIGAAAIVGMSGLFNDGPEQNTRLTFGSNNQAGNISINERGNEGKSDSYIAGAQTKSAFGTFGVTSTFWAPAESQTVQDFVKTVGLADDALASFLTVSEKASVTNYLTGKTSTANTGAEGQIQNAGAELSKVFAERIRNILEGVEPGLASLEADFNGTSQELANEAAALLQYRAALKDSGEAVFGAQVTLQQIAALKQPTEATSAALTRITNEFTATNQVAQLLGKDMSTAFGAAGLASEAARAQIILLSGGLSTFTSQVSSFAQNYLTDAERLAPVAKQLDVQLAALGLSTVPKTKDQFKALVMGLDLSTESGQKLYAGLMGLQDAFAQVHVSEGTAADVLQERKQLQDELDQLTMTSTQLLDKQRAALDASNRGLFDQVQALQAAKAVADERSQLQEQLDQLVLTSAERLKKQRDALDASNQALFDQIQAAQVAKDTAQQAAEATKQAQEAIKQAQEAAAASMRSIGSALADSMEKAKEAAAAFRGLNSALLLGDSSTLSNQQQYDFAKAQFATADSSNLKAAEDAFLSISKSIYGTSLQYARDFAAVIQRNSAEAKKQDSMAAAIPLFWQSLISSGVIGAHANGGVASGWSVVGEEGAELVNFTQPARVYTANQTRQMLGTGTSGATAGASDATLGKMLAATEECAKQARKTADLLTRVTKDGNALYTKEVT